MLKGAEPQLNSQIIRLAERRSGEGYIAEVRLLSDGWLPTENHCPIHSVAKQCGHFCDVELSCFQTALHGKADIDRFEHLLDGARRCTFKISSKKDGKLKS